MKKTFLVFFFLLFASVANAQSVKKLPTCIDFNDAYKKVVGEASENPTVEDKENMLSLASMMMGYVSAIQDVYGDKLVGLQSDDNEWTLLGAVSSICKKNPRMNFANAVRAVPSIADTIAALQQHEYDRCQNYINQTKATICLNYMPK
ncbi:MAG: hypothetical protein MJ247_00725 [Alphaproteobacteria bacterium]|nr:hypothetical protein [Alphaproteobacteria bacterium]